MALSFGLRRGLSGSISSGLVAPNGEALYTFVSATSDPTDLTEYDFTRAVTGGGDGLIGLLLGRASGSGALTLDSLSVNGASVTPLGQKQNVGANGCIAALFAVPFVGPDDALIETAFSRSLVRCGLALFRCRGANLTGTVSTGEGTNPRASMDVPAGGFIVGGGITGASTSATWNAEATEHWDTVVESFATLTAGGANFEDAQSSLSFGPVFGSNSDTAAIYAAFGPA